MPIHKKPLTGKVGEAGKAKIIQNIIKAPGKVLVKTAAASTTAQLRTIPTSKIVKPGVPPSAPFIPELQNAPSHDIVAAALSQSLGAPVSDMNEGPAITQVATSTPAASTIKAIAATYQKNSSTNQQKQIVTSQITSGVPPSLHDKPKVFLATSQSQSSSQAMLFTPNQPQIHRSPQSGSTLQRPRQNPQPNVPKPVSLSSTSGNTFLASVSKSSIPKTGQSVTSQPTKQPPIMQVKVLNQPTTTYSTQQQLPTDGKSSQLRSSDDMIIPITGVYSAGSSEDQTSTLQTAATSAAHSSDRTTFIYQYHSTSAAGSKQSSILQGGGLPLTVSSISTGDLITLHSIEPDGSSDIPHTLPEQKSLEMAQSRLIDSVTDNSNLSSIPSTSSTVPSVLIMPESFTSRPPHVVDDRVVEFDDVESPAISGLMQNITKHQTG